MNLQLPDCREVADPFFLTTDQRRELLLLLAEKGEAGLEEFVKRHLANDPRVAKRLRRMKEKLMQEAEELRRRLKSDYQRKRDDEQSRADDVLRRLRDEQSRHEGERRALDATLPDDLMRDVRNLPIIQLVTAPPRPVWWRRIYNWIWRIIHGLWHGFLRLIGLEKKSRQKAKGIAVGLPGLGGPGLAIDVDIETALLSSPDLRKRIRRGMGPTFATRTRRMWRILLGMENYADVAREIMERQADEATRQRLDQTKSERERLDKSLEKDRYEQEEREKALREELERLDRAEAQEEARLRETLSNQPVEELRRLVTEELESAGLVERLSGGLKLTGRFLETFAALVYAEESKGVAAVRESGLGSSIEGEGILEKTPLRSFAEISHMDTVATIVNARTRHPHVRHLVDEDVLVYREQRATEVHLVIIVDQSLSMEENDRIVAAKRAALALYYQSRRKGTRHKIDFVLMQTSVRRATLADVWDAKPGGFTNVGRALQVAHELLDRSRANRKLLFLVTDGLPEAVTFEGKDVAAKPDEALAYALRHAARLKRIPGLSFSLVLLEANDPLFVAAAEKIAKKVGGRVSSVDPKQLVKSLLVQVRQEELLAA